MQKIYTASVNLKNNTYENCQTITQVDLMQTPWVSNIMDNAFTNCINLQVVTNINNAVKNLAYAFENCYSLTNIPTLPTNALNLYRTFSKCNNLVNIPAIPPNVLQLAATFLQCTNIVTVPTIPNSVNNLNDCFYGCSSLAEVPSLENTNVPELTGTFSGCTNLVNQPALPNIGYLYHTFFGCSKLASINIPTNTHDLYETYYGCSNLTTIPNISNNMTNMYHTFGACVNISGDINILSDKIVNVTNLFGETSARKNVYIPPVCYNDTSVNSPTYNSFIAAGYDNIGTKDGVYLCYNYYPALPSDWTTSTAANGVTVLEKYIGTNTTVITPHNDWYSNKVLNEASYSDGPFQNNKNITSVDLANVEVINNSLYKCFDSCSNLQSVTNINQNVTNLVATFQLCESLTTPPVLPPVTTNMGGTFAYCYNLQSPPAIPQNVTYMDSTFRYCYQFTEIPTIPQSVTSLSYAFINCNNITTANVNVPNCINISNTFAGCSNLTDINIIAPNATDITNIFTNCTNLTNVHAEFNSITNASELFKGCKTLNTANIVIPNATNLCNAFYNCQTLNNLNLSLDSTVNLDGTFGMCYNLKSVPDIPSSVTSMAQTFYACESLTDAPNIANGITVLRGTYDACAKLVNVPKIPDSVRSMFRTFFSCYRLTNPPVLSNNVRNLSGAFRYCNHLATMPDLPSTVTDLSQAFSSCTRLTTTKTIPASVSNMFMTFYNCNKVTGNIYIQSNQISSASYCFDSTSLIKNVYIPFEYENGVATKTYNAFIAAGYGTEDYLHGVHLKDIDGSKVTINPTPADATVLMYNENTGKEIDETVLNKFSYIKTGDDVEITGLNTTDTEIIVPSIWTETKRMRAIEGSIIHYRVLKDGYNTVEGQITVDGSQTINVNLEQIICTFTVVPFPSDATVTLTAPAYSQSGNSITVPWGTEVSYTVSKEHYQTVTGTEIVKTTGSRYVPLAIDKHTFTINPTPADAAVQILVNGKLVNASSTDWIFTANNANGDIELQEYIGSNTVVVMPTSYETTNTVTADYGSTIEWTVSKQGYHPRTGTLTLEQDTILNIELTEITYGVNAEDYEYTLNSRIVTLTKYIGEGGDIDTPEIEEL